MGILHPGCGLHGHRAAGKIVLTLWIYSWLYVCWVNCTRLQVARLNEDPWGSWSFSVVKFNDQCPGSSEFWEETEVVVANSIKPQNSTSSEDTQIDIFSHFGHQRKSRLVICSHKVKTRTKAETTSESGSSMEGDTQEEDSTEAVGPPQWPPGHYCVLKTRGHPCPPGLIQGSLSLEVSLSIEEEYVQSAHIEYKSGQPASTDMYFCCSRPGNTSEAIALPPTSYLALFTQDGIRCQQVRGMTEMKGYVKIETDEEHLFSHSRKNISHPVAYFDVFDEKRSLKFYLCGYKSNSRISAEVDALRTAGTVVGGLLVICLVTLSVYKLRKMHKRRLSIQKQLTRSSLHGGDCYAQDGKVVCNEYMQTDTKGAQLSALLSCILEPGVKEQVQKLLVPRTTIDIKEKIGTGAFGCVFRARYSPNDEQVTAKLIAVKMIKETCSNEEIAFIIAEALLMAEVSHPNVLSLLGVSVEGEFGLPVLLLPLMENGDLHSYLRRFRYDEEYKDKTLSTEQLLVFGYQVARGMEYLASMKIVHRDLATRNCMVSDTLVVKVADFGLAKDMYTSSYYRQSTDIRLPVKWLALESLEDRVFTSQSDVWSYGVTLWEILTMGRTPYPSLDNGDVFMHIKQGGRLDQPEECPDNIYTLMKSCWNTSVIMRPTFAEIAHTIERHVTQAMGYLEVEADPGSSLMKALTNQNVECEPSQTDQYGSILDLENQSEHGGIVLELSCPVHGDKSDV